MNIDSFMDELEKISVRLSDKEQRSQALQFGGLGAAAMPAATGLSNIIQTGKMVPTGVSKGRWLAGNLVAGALAGGAVPALRHGIERRTQEKAKTRRKAEREARSA